MKDKINLENFQKFKLSSPCSSNLLL